MEWVKPGLDRLMPNWRSCSLEKWQIFGQKKILGLNLQLVLWEEYSTLKNSSYLNDGTGDPWAGQTNARLLKTMSSNATEFILDENFGLELPTGSKELIKSPNDWHDYY